jgi:hypothetical protein
MKNEVLFFITEKNPCFVFSKEGSQFKNSINPIIFTISNKTQLKEWKVGVYFMTVIIEGENSTKCSGECLNPKSTSIK